MKKYLLLAVLFSLVFVWCQKIDIATLDVGAITDVATLHNSIAQVSDAMQKWTLSMEQAPGLVDQLQQKYVDLVDGTDVRIESLFATIQKTFDNKAITLYSLPLWAKKAWMIQPKGMALDKTLSKQTYSSWSTSTMLVYKWNYTIALQQAKLIADNAHLYVSKNFQQAQALAKIGNIDYISGLDVGALSQWIVYVNHELLDTNIDQMLSVSVDQQWTLLIEASNYKKTQTSLVNTPSNTDTSSLPGVRTQWETCGEEIWNCASGLQCTYPCGIEGCENVCLPENELPKP